MNQIMYVRRHWTVCDYLSSSSIQRNKQTNKETKREYFPSGMKESLFADQIIRTYVRKNNLILVQFVILSNYRHIDHTYRQNHT